MAGVTFAQLLAGSTPEQVYAILLAIYQSNGFPTTSWLPGGTDATRTLAIATAISDLSANFIPTITQGGFTTLAANLDNSNIQVLAQQIYNLTFNPASFTIGDMTLVASATAGTYVIQPGQLTAVFADSGNRYINSTGGTLSPSGTLTLSCTAEEAGASYDDPNSSAITLVTPLAGVTVTNPAGTYTDVAHVGAGTGTFAPSGAPTAPHQVTIKINTTGSAADAEWSYSLDGSPYVFVGVGAATIPGTSITVTPVDGGSGTSFVTNDEYLFSCPGSWITTQGADVEANTALATRCQDRWSTLSNIPTYGYYELLARSTPGVGSQVTQTIVYPDTDINNMVNVVVAGPLGALPPATVATIQAFITPRAIGTDYPTVQSPSVHETTIAFTATVQAQFLVGSQELMAVAMNNYVDGSQINPTLRIASIIELAMQVTPSGASTSPMIDVSNVTIDGVAANLTLGSSTSFVVAQLATLNITWVTQ